MNKNFHPCVSLIMAAVVVCRPLSLHAADVPDKTAAVPGITPASTSRPVAPPVSKAATKPAVDPFDVGAEIEAFWNGNWTDAKVLSRNGPKAEVVFMDVFKAIVGPAEMRVRGVSPEEAAKLTSQTGLFARGAKIEYKFGQSWQDGVVTRRTETEIDIKASDGLTRRANSSDLRTRAVAPSPPAVPAEPSKASTDAPRSPMVDQSHMLIVTMPEPGLRALPDPATQPVRPLGTAKAIPLPPVLLLPGKRVVGRASRIILSPGTTHGLVAFTFDALIANCEVCKIDFATGIVGPIISFPDGLSVEDVSPDGSQFLLRASPFGANLVQVWSIERQVGKPVPWKVKEFQPFGTSIFNHVDRARFIDNDHAVCGTAEGNLIMIELPTLKAIWTIDGTSPSSVAISPGRKLVACMTPTGLFILEALTGRVVQVFKGFMMPSSDLAFSPTGKRLAAASVNKLIVCDLESQDQWREVAFHRGLNPPLDWIDDGNLVVGGQKLVDVEKRIITWTFSHPEADQGYPVTCAANGKFWFLTAEAAAFGSRRQLNPIALPTPEVTAAIASLKPDEVFLVHPGTKVSIQITTVANGDEQQKILAGLTAAAKAAGLVVADGQPVVLSATSRQQQLRPMAICQFADVGPPAFTMVNVKPALLELAIKSSDGKVAWSIKSSNLNVQRAVTINGRTRILATVEIKKGQTVEEAVGELQTPNFSFLHNPTIPSYIPLPRDKEGFGESNLTARGPQMLKPVPQ